MINYSIIIPHKNNPHLLERCLASIPRRLDTEIILVDDNSDPSCVDFDHFPGMERDDVRVVLSKNEDGRCGAGTSRNRALDMVSGKWVVFVDSDDLMLPAAAEMMDKYVDSSADIIFFGNTVCHCDTLEPHPQQSPMSFIAEYLATGDRDRFLYRMHAPWARFIRRSLIENHNVRFSETRYGEDMIFQARAAHFAGEIVVDPTPVYCYTLRPVGALSSPDNRTIETLFVQFDEDMKVARFLLSVGNLEAHRKLGLFHWKELMRIDRRRARPLLAQLREVYPPSDVKKMARKMRYDPLVAPFRKLILGREL